MAEEADVNPAEEVAAQSQSASLDRLPDIVVEKILEKLSALGLLRAMSTSNRLMELGLPLVPDKCFDFAEEFEDVPEDELRRLLEKFGDLVREVRFRSTRQLWDGDGLGWFSSLCPKLTSLKINVMCGGEDDVLLKFFRNCPDLQILAMCNYPENQGAVSLLGHSFDEVPIGLKALYIDFHYATITNDIITHVADRCEDLERFEATFLNEDAEESVAELVYLLENCPNVWYFSLKNILGPWLSEFPGVNPLRALGAGLTVLKTYGTRFVSDDVIGQVVDRCPNLATVQFGFETWENDHFTAAGLRQLASLEHLTSLSLQRCDANPDHPDYFFNGLRKILAKGKLTHLDVSDSASCTNNFLVQVLVTDNYPALRVLECKFDHDAYPTWRSRLHLLDSDTVESILEKRLEMAQQGKMHPIRIDATGSRAVRTSRIKELLGSLNEIGCRCEFLPGK